MQRREEEYTITRRIKYIEDKLRKPGNTLVTQQQTNGITLTITDKTPLEKVIIVENMKEYHHNEGAFSLLDDPRLYLDIRAFDEGSQVEAILNGTYVYPDNTNPPVKTFLRHLQRPTTVSDKEPPTLMSLSAYKQS